MLQECFSAFHRPLTTTHRPLTTVYKELMTAYSPHQLHTLFRELGSSYMLLVYMRNYPQPAAQGWLSRVSGHSLKTIREKLKVLYDRGLIEPAARYQWLLTPTAIEVLDSRWSPEAETLPNPLQLLK
jgi:hypothetical protein